MKYVNPFSIPDPFPYFIPVFLLFIAIETYITIKQRKQQYDCKDTLANVGLGFMVSLINISFKSVHFMFIVFAFQFRLFDGLAPMTDADFFDLSWHLNHWWLWVILFIADDFTMYWVHRAAHKVRIMWAGHIVHHSSDQFNFTTAFREGWFEYIYKYFFWCWLPLVGFHPLMVFTMAQINLAYGFFVHTEMVKKMPKWYEFIFNTPSHHRVHHASDVHYLDKNFGGVLIIWDRMFGTFAKETSTPTYGITEKLQTYNIFKIAGHELCAIVRDIRKATNCCFRFKYIFLAPGWSHDGKDMRVNRQQNPNGYYKGCCFIRN